MNPRQTAALALLEMDRREGYSNLTLEPRLQRAGFSPQDRQALSALMDRLNGNVQAALDRME